MVIDQNGSAKYFKYLVQVEQSHIDGLQHVNNACYVNWCEQAAWSHSKSLGVELQDFHNIDRAMAIRSAHYEYQEASHSGDQLEVKTWLSDFSALGMKRHFVVTRKSDSAVVVKADWLLVCIEISTGKPKRLPNLFKEKYGAQDAS